MGIGLLKGLGVTLKTMGRTMFPARGIKTLIPAPSKGAATVQYPHEKEAPAPRARGVIALKEENCTVCMLCARSCPDWCIYIEGHKDTAPPRRPGGKPRTVNGRPLRHRSRAACGSASGVLSTPVRFRYEYSAALRRPAATRAALRGDAAA
jgi:ferredoxin